MDINRLEKTGGGEPSNTSSISVLPPSATVFHNQNVYVTVKIEKASLADVTSILAFKIVPETPNTISVLSQGDISINVSDRTHPYAEQDFILTILQKTSGDIKFNVSVIPKDGQTVKIPAKTISYTVSTANISQNISLDAEKKFIVMPTTSNPITENNSTYNSYTGKLIATDGHTTIANALIYIFSQRDGQFSNLINITTEPGKGITGSEIPVGKFGGHDFFTVQTGPLGVFGFRAYPIENTPVRVDFMTMIPGVTEKYLASSVYVFPEDSITPDISAPTVVGMEDDGTIVELPDDSTFSVKIDSYIGIQDTDELVFFVKNNNDTSKTKQQLEPTYPVQNKDSIEQRKFKFTFDQLVPNQGLGLTCVAIPQIDQPKYSYPLYINYYKDENNPGNNKNRVYEKVMVFSNKNINPKPNDTNGLVKEGVPITSDTISNGILFDGSDNSKQVGLYIIINVSSGQSTKDQLPEANQIGYLRVAPTGKKAKTINFKLTTANVLTDLNQNKYSVIKVPFCYLTWIGLDEVAKIYIDYTITDSEGAEIGKSKLWETDIITDFPGVPEGTNLGCYADES